MDRRGTTAAGAWVRGAGPRSWLMGAGFSLLLWTWPTYATVWTDDGAPWTGKVLITALTLLFFACYALGPPLIWTRPAGRTRVRTAVLVLLALLTSNLLVVFSLGPAALWTWTFLACAVAMTPLAARWRFLLIFALAIAALIVQSLGDQPELGVMQASLVVSLGCMMMAFARQIELRQQLEATRKDLADAAVAAERDRMARDMHDILGHSLTVVAVKAELARRLLAADPHRAERELGEIEELARGALADVRATVAGYRGVNVVAELAQARQVLGSAGIEADLPGAVDQVSAGHRELFGWVVREGVTNVLRHSHAGRCRITFSPDGVQVDDDGAWRPAGPVRSTAGPEKEPQWSGRGTGLDGLAERVRQAGGTLSTGPSELGGFRLTVVM
ncbi:sensor histidine kinase [Arthrobacter sp. NPDC090010]|uniref:sensor histidine kinase n=1 Tax=Arthrobacter sp. NPDC090010 TaxID=3363942 RepID=UPI0037F11DCC